MAATVVALNAQTETDVPGLVVTPQTTQPPRRVLTADEVIEGGGDKTGDARSVIVIIAVNLYLLG